MSQHTFTIAAGEIGSMCFCALDVFRNRIGGNLSGAAVALQHMSGSLGLQYSTNVGLDIQSSCIRCAKSTHAYMLYQALLYSLSNLWSPSMVSLIWRRRYSLAKDVCWGKCVSDIKHIWAVFAVVCHWLWQSFANTYPFTLQKGFTSFLTDLSSVQRMLVCSRCSHLMRGSICDPGIPLSVYWLAPSTQQVWDGLVRRYTYVMYVYRYDGNHPWKVINIQFTICMNHRLCKSDCMNNVTSQAFKIDRSAPERRNPFGSGERERS